MSEIWFSADLHLAHTNIIGYCNRPFDNIHHMYHGLLERWNNLVAPEDTVWVLGDLAMGIRSETVPSFSAFNGRKVLIAGNHDNIWGGNPRLTEQNYAEVLDLYTTLAGIESVYDSGKTLIGSETVLLSHFPYEEDERHKERYAEFRPKNEGLWLVHGHVHDLYRQRGRQINVGVDAWNMEPVHIESIHKLMREGPKRLPPLPITR